MVIEVSAKKIVITGALSSLSRSQATEQLEALGAVVTKSVTSSTDILFCGERAGMKLEKAEALGVAIYQEAELQALLGDEAAVARAASKSAALDTDAPVSQEIEDGEKVLVQGSAACYDKIVESLVAAGYKKA